MIGTRMLLALAFAMALLLPTTQGSEPESVLLELRGAAPEWFTPEAREAAIDAAAKGLLYNPLTDDFVEPRAASAPAGGIPAGAPDYLFIRPGALFLGANGALCTYNFIYDSGTRIGTAGHCVEAVGDRVFIVAAPTVPLVTALGSVHRFSDGGIGNDWALINIDPAWHDWVDPNLAYVGGPSCIWDGTGGWAKTVGHGVQTGLVASVPRVHRAATSDGKSTEGLGAVSGGDSGSPLVRITPATPGCAQGAAAGIVTHCTSIGGLVCLPLYTATDVRRVPATVTPGFDPL